MDTTVRLDARAVVSFTVTAIKDSLDLEDKLTNVYPREAKTASPCVYGWL